MTEGLVSVIIPTYGGNLSLEKAINSVLIQNYQWFEIIVVDDNDPDTEQRSRTELIMKKYENDQRVIYYKHKKNKNGAAARNTGAKVAKGSYLAFLDDDDIFLQDKLRKQVEFLNVHSEYAAVYCGRKEGNRIIIGHLQGNLSRELLDLSFTPCTDSLMLRTESFWAINGFDETYVRHQDFEFLLRYFKLFKIGVIEEPLLCVVGNEVDNQPHGKKAVEIKKKFLDTFQNDIKEIDKKYKGFRKKVYAKHYSGLILKLLRYGNLGLAIKVYFTDAYKGGLLFWNELFNQLKNILKNRFRNEGKTI